jgi:hypothetical protein
VNNRFFIAAIGLSSVSLANAQPSVQAAPKPIAFQSAMQGYQPYTNDKTVDWKAANQTTARIGGWRAYAREASAPAVAPVAADLSAKAAPKP